MVSFMIPQVLLVVRFILGMVFVGETRVQFNPTCVAVSSVVPISITIIALDATILTLLAFNGFSSRPTKDAGDDGEEANRNKAVLLTIAGLAIWMGVCTSVLEEPIALLTKRADQRDSSAWAQHARLDI